VPKVGWDPDPLLGAVLSDPLVRALVPLWSEPGEACLDPDPLHLDG
jgi:hypothetical protein